MTKSVAKKDRTETREYILSTAARCFREKGYAAVSLRDIAKAADATTGSIYYHFSSKDDIVKEVLNLGHTNVRRAVEETLKQHENEASSQRLLAGAIKTHILCLFGEDSLPSANIRIFSQVPDDVVSAAMQSRRAYENLWLKLLEQARVDGSISKDLDTELLVPILFGAMNWTIEWFDPADHDLDQVVEQVLKLLT